MEILIIVFGIIFLVLVIKTIIDSNIPSWFNKKINSLVRGTKISSKQITGISPLLKDIEFSVDKPSLFGLGVVIILTIAIVYVAMWGIFIGFGSVLALTQPLEPQSNPDFRGEFNFGGLCARFFCASILLVGGCMGNSCIGEKNSISSKIFAKHYAGSS